MKEGKNMLDESKLTEFYQEIADKMDEMIPVDWERIILRAEQIPGMTSIGFYFLTDDKEYHWSNGIFEEYDVNRNELNIKDYELADAICRMWLEFKDAGEPVWSVFTMDWNGEQIRVNFDYEEIDNKVSTLTRRDVWAYDELGIVPDSSYARGLFKEYFIKQGRELPDELK